MLNIEVVKVVGFATGVTGVSLGLALGRFEKVIREKLFPEMQPHQAYTQLRLITGAVWTAAILGICLWLYAVSTIPRQAEGTFRPARVSHGLTAAH